MEHNAQPIRAMREQNLQNLPNYLNFREAWSLCLLLMLLTFAPIGAKAQYTPVVWYSFDNAPYGQNVAGTGNNFFPDTLLIGGDNPVRDSFLQIDDQLWPPFAQGADSGRVFDEITVEFWYRADKGFFSAGQRGRVALLNQKCHFEFGEQGMYWTVVTLPATVHELYLPFYGAGVTDAHNLLDGRWHHFAGTFDVKTGTQRLYIDGRNESGMTRHHGTTSAMNTSSAFVPYTALNSAVGDLDEMAFYDTVLPPDLIWQHYFNGLQGQPYAANIDPLGPFAPTPQNVAQGSIDTLEFCPGYPATPVGTPALLAGYPAPRYRPTHQMPRLLPWFNDSYNIANNLPVPYYSAGGPPLRDMLRRLATDYNYYLYLGGAQGYLGVDTTKQEWYQIQAGNDPANLLLPRFVVTNWSHVHPQDASPLYTASRNILYQLFPFQFYARDMGNVPTTAYFNTKRWNWAAIRLPNDPRLQFLDQDGLTSRFYVSLVNAAVPHQISMIGENEETLIAFDSLTVWHDPEMSVDRANPPRTLDQYQARRSLDFRQRYSDHYRHFQNSRPWQQDSVQIYWYNAGGNQGYSGFSYDTARFINRFADGIPRGTDYWYPQAPARWRYGTSAVTGFRELVDGRRPELLAGDRRFMPAVSPGFNEAGTWSSPDRSNLRPGQFLGCLKALGMMGADGYSLFMHHGISPLLVPTQGSWRAWQPAMPAYAQAVTDRLGDLIGDGYLLEGDLGGNRYMFATGNPLDLIVGRKADNADRYAIHGSVMRLDNAPSHGPKEKDVCISLADSNGTVIDTLLFLIRAQGSTYILDMTTPDTIFYQLDGWHEWMEPWRWCRDFVLEGELADTVLNGTQALGTEHAGSGADYREFTTWTHMVAGQELKYQFSTRHVEQDTLYLWVRGRWTLPSALNGVSVTFGPSGFPQASAGVAPIPADTFSWSVVPLVLPLPGQKAWDLHVIANHNGIEIDKVLLSRSGNPFVGAVFMPLALVEDSIVCLGDSARFHAGGKLPPGCLDYRWDFGDGNFAYSADPAHLYAWPDTYQVVLAVHHACLDSTAYDTVTVVIDAPHVEAGRDTFMCHGDTMQLQGAGSYFFKWREDSIVTSPIIPNPFAWPNTSGYMHIDAWDPLTGCHASDSAYITILGQPPVNDTTIFFCDNPGFPTQIGIPRGPGQYWAWFAPDTLIASISGHEAWVNVTAAHVFTAYVSDFCRCDTDTVAISVLPVVGTINAYASQDTICQGDTLWLIVDGMPDSPDGPDWTGLFGTFPNGSLDHFAQGQTVWALPPALGWATGPQTLTYIVSGNSCLPASQRIVSDTVVVVLMPAPFLDGWQDTIWACPGRTFSYTPNTSTPAPNSWLWAPAFAFVNPANDTATISGLVVAPTPFSVTVNSALGCAGVQSGVLMPMGLLADSLYQCPGDDLHIGVSASFGAGAATNVTWSPPQFFANPTAPVTTVSVPSPTQVSVIYNLPGCPQMYDTMLVIPHGLPEVVGPDTVRGCAGDTIALNVQDASPVVWGISGLSVGDSTATSTWTIFQGTPFTLYVASCDSFFCPGFDSVLVTWLDAIPGPDTIRACLNDTIVIPGLSGGVSCVWSPMTDVLNTNNCTLTALPQQDRWYKLVWTDAGGCIAKDSVWIDIDSVSITGQLLPPFSGNLCFTDSLQLHATGGTTIAWSPATWLSNANIASPWADPQATQEYHVRISNGGSCIVEDSVTITVDGTIPPGVLTVDKDTICLGESIKLNTGGGIAYDWEGPLIGNMTAPSITTMPPYTSFYAVTVSDGGVCEWEDSVLVLVENCCFVPNATPFHNATATQVCVALGFPPGICNNRRIHVIDTLHVDVNTVFTNCDFFMDSMAVVMVPMGITLTLDNCRMQAGCGYMWEGINVRRNNANCNVRNASVIRDALWAVRSVEGGRYTISNSTFRSNWVGVRVGPYLPQHSGVVTGTHFTSNSAQMLPPHAGRPGECGIWTEAVDSIRIGGNLWATRNTFDSLGIGIIADRSNIWVTNNLFSAMPVQANVKGNPGYGHYGTGIVAYGQPGVQRPTDNWWMNVGGDSLKTNRFVDIMQGIKVVDNNNLNASYNTFRRNSGIAVRIQLNYYNTLWVRNNAFWNCAVGVKGTLNTGSKVDVRENRITGSAAYPCFGVWLSDLNVFGTNLPNNGSETVADNLMTLRGMGVAIEGVGEALVQHNDITVTGVHPQLMRGTGIGVYASDKAKVKDNILHSTAPSLNDSVDGLSFVLSNRLGVTCNKMFNFQTALHTWGSCDGSYVRWNEFTGGRKGIVLQDNGIIGQQGLPDPPGPAQGEPSGNLWLGNWNCGAVVKMAFTVNTTPGNAQPIFVRNNVQMKPSHPSNPGCNGFVGGGAIQFTNTVGLIPNCPQFPPIGISGPDPSMLTIAANTRQYPVLPLEGRVVDRQMLLDTLNKDVILRQSHPQLMAFHAAHSNGTLGKISRSQESLVALQPTLSVSQATYAPTNAIEENHKAVAAVLFRLQGLGQDLSMPDSLALEQIAAQCPLTGGKAVYIARTILELVTPGRFFDDANCVSTQKAAFEGIEVVTNTLLLVPNPASTQVKVVSTANCTVWVYDMQGHEMSQLQVNGGELFVDISGWARGVYLFRYLMETGEVGSIRLVVQ
jgi:PKD domain/Concanavalin A-like lectin/glucanases superfamily